MVEATFEQLQANARIIVKVLQDAKQYLYLGNGYHSSPLRRQFVCHAIRQTGDWNYDSADITHRVAKYVNDSLNGSSVFEDWLEKSMGETAYNALSHKQIQRLRLRWMNKIIRDLTRDYKL
jgi:hypothetical protein